MMVELILRIYQIEPNQETGSSQYYKPELFKCQPPERLSLRDLVDLRDKRNATGMSAQIPALNSEQTKSHNVQPLTRARDLFICSQHQQ